MAEEIVEAPAPGKILRIYAEASQPIARLYADVRVGRIYGGANEVMKEIIARAMEKQ